MRIRNGFVAAVVLAVVAGVMAPGWSAPQPAVIPSPETWQVDIHLHGSPQEIELVLPGASEATRYWYVLYTITNNSGRDVTFYPKFEMFTDTFKLYRGGEQAHPAIFESIRARYVGTIPLLESQESVTGRILQGQDYARDSVAIFEDFDPNATGVRVFMSGLSNESVFIPHPVDVDEETQKPREVLLRKTLMLEYQVSGDRLSPKHRSMLYQNRKWIMR